MKLKELKFLIRQIVREEIINLVKEKEVSLSPPKTIFIKEKNNAPKKLSQYKNNPFKNSDEDYYNFSSDNNNSDVLRLKQNLEDERNYSEEGEDFSTELEAEENTLEDKIENEDTSHLKTRKDIFDL